MKTASKNNPRIAVVGASIAGAAVAIGLSRLGMDVTVFERSAPNFDDRGAGIMLPTELVAALIRQDFVDATFPVLTLSERKYFTNDPQMAEREKLLTDAPLSVNTTHWHFLQRQLAKRLSTIRCLYQTPVMQVKEVSDQGVVLEINNQLQQFDYCIFADGYDSLGRRFLFPDYSPQFADYIAWRGVMKCSDPQIVVRNIQQATYYLFPNGHLLIYPLPCPEDPDAILLNWILYEKTDNSHALFRDNLDAARRNWSRTALPHEYRHYLQSVIAKKLPAFPRWLIESTESPFVQAIYDLYLPHYLKDRAAVIGDASILLRPHAGAGAAKALNDALALMQAVATHQDFSAALTAWASAQMVTGTALFCLSERLATLFVTATPDWQTLNRESLDLLIKRVVEGFDWYITAEKKD